jgi:hypothetical protein
LYRYSLGWNQLATTVIAAQLLVGLYELNPVDP